APFAETTRRVDEDFSTRPRKCTVCARPTTVSLSAASVPFLSLWAFSEIRWPTCRRAAFDEWTSATFVRVCATATRWDALSTFRTTPDANAVEGTNRAAAARARIATRFIPGSFLGDVERRDGRPAPNLA